MDADYAGLCSNSRLQDALSAAAAARKLGSVEIAFWCGDELYRAALLADAPAPAHVCRVSIGCLAKPMTATLVAHACHEGLLDLHWKLSRFACMDALGSDSKQRLDAIRLLDLLNHTHGLDDSLVSAAPRRTDDFLDVEQLCSALFEVPALAEAGEQFSYGRAGIWLAAALLESVYGKPYAVLLQEKLLGPLAIHAECDARYICPAGGNALRLSAHDLSKFAVHHLQCDASNPLSHALASLRGHPFAPPGWQPRFRKVCLGWNDFGDGWFGHNALQDRQSAVIRFAPALGTAIAITGVTEHAAYAALGAVFGAFLPEFSCNTPPVPLSAAEWSKVDSRSYAGQYENAALSLLVDIAAKGMLRVRVFRKHHQASAGALPYIKRYMQPAAERVFFASPPESTVIPFIQFQGVEQDGRYRYLQNGHQTFRRV